MAHPIRDTLEGGVSCPLLMPLSELSHVPSHVTISLFLGPAIGLSKVPGIGPAVAESGGGSMRLPGLLGGMKTEELRPGGWPLAYGIKPCETCELRPGGGRDMLIVKRGCLGVYGRFQTKLSRSRNEARRSEAL